MAQERCRFHPKWLKNGADAPKSAQDRCRRTKNDSRTVPIAPKMAQERCRFHQKWLKNDADCTKNAQGRCRCTKKVLKDGADAPNSAQGRCRRTKKCSRTVPTHQKWLKNGSDAPKSVQERCPRTKNDSRTVPIEPKMAQERCRFHQKWLQNGADCTKKCSTTGGIWTKKLIGFKSILRTERVEGLGFIGFRETCGRFPSYTPQVRKSFL